MKTKIIELQNNIKTLHKEIADLEKLAADNDTSGSTINATLDDLIEQKNDLLISESLGADKKTEIANLEKLIKAARNELEKNNEKARFVEAIQKRIEQKHENLSDVQTKHQNLIIDCLREMVEKKVIEKNALFDSYLDAVCEIDALNDVGKFLPIMRYGELCSEIVSNRSLLFELRQMENAGSFIQEQKTENKVSEIRALLEKNKIDFSLYQ